MFILSVPWDLRALWVVLTITSRAYVLCFVAGLLYSTYSFPHIGLRLRQLLKHMPSTSRKDARPRRLGMSGEVRQFHTLLLLVFGVCFVNETFATLRTIRYSEMSLCPIGIEAFEPALALAFCVLAALAFLHAFQWAVAARMQPVSCGDQN